MASSNIEEIKVDLQGRVRSLSLAERNNLLPLFEAIVNSIHAIEDAGIADGEITIKVVRENAMRFEDNTIPSIEGFSVYDNGIGFTNDNYESFKTAFSTHKASKGGKGLGRFIWLKAFNEVKIESEFNQEGIHYHRGFVFNLSSGIEKPIFENSEENLGNKTVVHLRGFRQPFKSKCPKKLSTIGHRIIEHCLIYFLEKQCPSITLEDSEDRIHLNTVFAEIVAGKIFKDTFLIKSHEFTVTFLKWFHHEELTHHRISYCANNREVESFNLNKVLTDLNGKIPELESRKQFLIVGYLESYYFDDFVNEERTEIRFGKDGLFESGLIQEIEIHKEISTILKTRFDDVVQTAKAKKIEIITNFIQQEAPQYRMLLKDPTNFDHFSVSDNISQSELDLKLYKLMQDLELKSKMDFNEIVSIRNSDQSSPDELRHKYQQVLEKVSELNKAKLVNYVVHRRYIIELFEKSIEINAEGKFDHEKVVHEIIFPQRKTSDEIDFESQNLWLLDERLNFHTLLHSDLPLKQIDGLNTLSTDRPDIAIFNQRFLYGEGDGSPYNSITIIEFKRPMRNDYSDDTSDPVAQLYRYVDEIRSGKEFQKNGRPFRITDQTKFYLYLICDDTPKLKSWAKIHSLRSTMDGLGYFGYNTELNCSMDVLPFDFILSNAKKRSAILFHKLGIS